MLHGSWMQQALFPSWVLSFECLLEWYVWIIGTVRDREKNFRGLKSEETPIINLNTIFYNFIRKHSAIGMTPAQASGIGNDLGQDKWLGLIKQAQEQGDKALRENQRLQQLKNEWRKMGWID